MVVVTDDEKEHFIPDSHFYMLNEKADCVAVGEKIEVMFMDRIGIKISIRGFHYVYPLFVRFWGK